VDVPALVHAAVDVLQPDADAKGVTIEVIVPAADVTLVGDGARLQQVLWNLLSNAVKFTPKDGRISIRVNKGTSEVRIEFTDTGQGSSAGLLPLVFDRFKQGEEEKRRAPRGLGLGLALVREMVQAHGGTVVADSLGEGRGSTFTVTLPTDPSKMVGPRKMHADHAQPVIDALPRVEILIVDDEADARDLLTLLLESRGANVRAVSSAEEAVKAIRERTPDVLLADVGMPDEDGLSLIRRVRAQEREQRQHHLPAIAVTAYASGGDREHAITAGYDGHVAKPIDPNELARMIVKVAEAENA
jgi:CheY-like chemotaxis protein